jgi:hypothetical protein
MLSAWCGRSNTLNLPLCEGVLEAVEVVPKMANHGDPVRQHQEAAHQGPGGEMGHASVLVLVWVSVEVFLQP